MMRLIRLMKVRSSSFFSDDFAIFGDDVSQVTGKAAKDEESCRKVQRTTVPRICWNSLCARLRLDGPTWKEYERRHIICIILYNYILNYIILDIIHEPNGADLRT